MPTISETHKALPTHSLPHFIQVVKKQRYRFSLLVNELRYSELSAYTASLLALINSLVIGHEDHPKTQTSFVLIEFIGKVQFYAVWVR